MRSNLFESRRDEVILLARVLMMILFIVFGWQKLTGFSGTVAYMAQVGAPLPMLAAVVAVVMEFFVAIAVMLGLFTVPLAFIFALYTLATGFIGHPFWHMTGAEHYMNEINFLKNVSIMGGLLLLAASGPGRYSADALIAAARPQRRTA